MVKEKKHTVLFLAVPAVFTVYTASSHVFPVLFVAAAGTLFLFSALTAILYFSDLQILRSARLVCFGLLLGFIALCSIDHRAAPIITLAPRNRITALTGELVSDPIPAGPDFYRTTVKMCSLETGSGNWFSATGRADIFLPAAMVRQSLPGGVTLKPGTMNTPGNTQTVSTCQLLAKGAILTVPVRYHRPDANHGERFTIIPEINVVAGDQWISPFARIRSNLRLSLMRMLYDWKESGGLLLALLSGNRDYIQSDLALAFRNAGLSHILALSGMHLSILGGIALGLSMGAGGKKFSVKFTLLVLCGFVWFAGNSPSLDRALIMALAAAVLRASGIQAGVLSLLAFSALVQLCINPEQTYSLAFILSYTALAGIVLAGKWITVLVQPWIPVRAISPLSASIGAQLFTIPVIALSFGVLSPAGSIAACVVSPFVTLFLVMGLFFAGVSALFSGITGIILPVYNGLYRIITGIVQWFASIPGIVLKDLSAMLGAGILCLAGIVLLYVLYERTCARRAPDALFTGL